MRGAEYLSYRRRYRALGTIQDPVTQTQCDAINASLVEDQAEAFNWHLNLGQTRIKKHVPRERVENGPDLTAITSPMSSVG